MKTIYTRYIPTSAPERQTEIATYIDLVNKFKAEPDKVKQDQIFNELLSLLNPRINTIVNCFHIAGMDRSDVYQEALFALRFKAIKDYNSLASNGTGGPSPFDMFAQLVIRRHLGTIGSTAKKKKQTLNRASSIDADVTCHEYDNENHMSDLIATNDVDISERDNQYHILNQLYRLLSPLEKRVFLLDARGLSYKEIAEKINYRRRQVNRVDLKGIDNAKSRIKAKGRELNTVDLFS